VIQLQTSSLHVTGHVRLGRVWLAIVMVCTNPSVSSCDVFINVKRMYNYESKCREAVTEVSNYYIRSGSYTKGSCIKMGEGA
jgi:hypothetical protein